MVCFICLTLVHDAANTVCTLHCLCNGDRAILFSMNMRIGDFIEKAQQVRLFVHSAMLSTA
jgi:hypothetical protein